MYETLGVNEDAVQVTCELLAVIPVHPATDPVDPDANVTSQIGLNAVVPGLEQLAPGVHDNKMEYLGLAKLGAIVSPVTADALVAVVNGAALDASADASDGEIVAVLPTRTVHCS